MIEEISRLLEHDTAGDPITGIKWSRRTPEKIAEQLQKIGIAIKADTVARLLGQMDYSLRRNRKYLESGNKNPPSKEDRDLQFQTIDRLRKEYTSAGYAVISIDTKKRELIGNFKNDGSTWRQHPDDVFDHDFPSDATGVAIPYGIYDTNRNHGSVYIGYSFDTGEFAVDCIKNWWLEVGRNHYREPKILILADCGGSNGARLRLWKKALEKVLCDQLGLHIRVCHYPPGKSKCNPIEHRLFSEISKNWAGQPLRSYTAMLNYIRTTKTKTGLKVRARMITKTYKKGIRITDKEFIAMHNTAAIPSYGKSLYFGSLAKSVGEFRFRQAT